MSPEVTKEIRDVTIGVIILDLLVVAILFITSNFSRAMLFGLVFGTIIGNLNFRLLALALEKAVNMPTRKAQAYTSIRYLIRVFIIAITLFVSVKNPNLNIMGTALGLVSTQIVIFVKNLVVQKFKRKEI